jgi:hypothetical protein
MKLTDDELRLIEEGLERVLVQLQQDLAFKFDDWDIEPKGITILKQEREELLRQDRECVENLLRTLRSRNAIRLVPLENK